MVGIMNKLNIVIFNIILIAFGCRSMRIDKNEDIQSRLIGGAPLDNEAPWIVYMQQKSTHSRLGLGAIVADRWVLCTSFVVEEVEDEPMDILIYSGVRNSHDLSTADEHRGKEILVHEDAEDTLNGIALVMCFPDFKDGLKIDLPAATIQYTVSDLARIIDFDENTGVLTAATKNVGAASACEETANWFPALMICLANNPGVYGEQADTSLPVVIDDKLAGFLMEPQNSYKVPKGVVNQIFAGGKPFSYFASIENQESEVKPQAAIFPDKNLEIIKVTELNTGTKNPEVNHVVSNSDETEVSDSVDSNPGENNEESDSEETEYSYPEDSNPDENSEDSDTEYSYPADSDTEEYSEDSDTEYSYPVDSDTEEYSEDSDTEYSYPVDSDTEEYSEDSDTEYSYPVDSDTEENNENSDTEYSYPADSNTGENNENSDPEDSNPEENNDQIPEEAGAPTETRSNLAHGEQVIDLAKYTAWISSTIY